MGEIIQKELISIGERIAFVRKQAGLSQKELAKKIHVQRQTISNWEIGLNTPPIERIHLICEICNCSADFLICNLITDYDKLKSENDKFKKMYSEIYAVIKKYENDEKKR